MISKLRYVLILVLGIGWLSAGAESLDDPQISAGELGYVNANSLEIGIDGNIFQLDPGFRIHGLSGTDRVRQLGELTDGMWVRYRVSGSKPGFEGVIQELWVQPN